MLSSPRRVADTVLTEVARAFGVTAVREADQIADFGVDSVVLLGLISALREQFGVPIDIVDVLQAESVGDYVALLERLTGTDRAPSVPTVEA